MSKLRLIYIASLVILGVLLIATVYLIPQALEFTEAESYQLVETEDEYVLELHVSNNEEKDVNYTVSIAVDGEPYTGTFCVGAGKVLGVRYHIYPEMLTEGELSFAVYREGEPAPIEEGTYFVDFDR